jgi:type II secretion system protein H
MTTSPNRIQRTDGFSMPEIMIVLVLVAVMASMAVPSMSAFVERTKSRRALDRLVTDVSLARQLAVMRGAPVAIVLQANATYRVDTLSTADSWVAARTVQLAEEYPGVAIVGSVNRIEFNSRGLLTAAADTGFITIEINGARDSAFVSGAGRVYRAY